jgi:hypothetical protein
MTSKDDYLRNYACDKEFFMPSCFIQTPVLKVSVAIVSHRRGPSVKDVNSPAQSLNNMDF